MAVEQGNYRLLRGRFRGTDGELLEAGAIVPLTAHQAASWANLFEPAGDEQPAPPNGATAPQVELPKQDAAPEAAPNIDEMDTAALRVFAQKRWNRGFKFMHVEKLRTEIRALLEAEHGGHGS